MKTLNDLQKYAKSNTTALYSNIEIEHLDLVRKILKENNLKTKVFFRGKNRRKIEYNYFVYQQCLKKDASTFSVYRNTDTRKSHKSLALQKQEYNDILTKHNDVHKSLKTEVLSLLDDLSEYVMNSNYSVKCNTFILSNLDALKYQI